ncbi:hypothetical protein CFC21_111884 [Triticum aestivum]|uniref:RING-type E3 ubiquitin transferase n=2 Tax=Triticum aestivum TaxID=4565 RepID=A0A9R1NFJ3_WHEAT|nr:hypothetical protein CFC21_111883 [Triticum aestivum]KAF7111929.1 hypothetical protein CFC21_111884 [Triticum aestivum]
MVVMGDHLIAVGRDVVISEPPMPTATSEDNSTAKSTIISVVVCVMFLLLFFCGYMNRHCRHDHGGTATCRPAPEGGGASSGRGKSGLDQSVVATFPVMPWRDLHKKKRAMVEAEDERCPVCLTAFEEGDSLRLLPHCSHVFHPECIDPWLQRRATCPLCWANLERPLPADAVAIAISAEGSDDDMHDGMEELAMELEMLRAERRAARLLPAGT